MTPHLRPQSSPIYPLGDKPLHTGSAFTMGSHSRPRRPVRASIRPSGLAALCMALLLLVVLAACGDGGAALNNGEAQATSTPTKTQAAAGPEPTEEPDEAMSTMATAQFGPRMTVEEYAEACDEKDPPAGFMDITPWGELGDHLEDVVAWLKGMNPPEELAAYHEAQILFAEDSVAFARSKPPGELGDSDAMIRGISEWDSSQKVLAAIEEVDSTTRAAMDAEGCW